jgi:hypothetical protein
MYSIRRFIGRLLFPRKSKFMDKFEYAYIEAEGETQKFDLSVKDLSIHWIAQFPFYYFSKLFLIGKEEWIFPFYRAFDRSNIVDAQNCYCLTQGFFLRLLFEIIRQDATYQNYSQETISYNIRSKMRFGTTILDFSDYFHKATAGFRLDDRESKRVFWEYLPMCYVEKVLEIQYTDQTIVESLLSSIWIDNKALSRLMLFTLETVKKLKYVDSDTSSMRGNKKSIIARKEVEKKSEIIEQISKVLHDEGVEHKCDQILPIKAEYRISLKRKNLFSHVVGKNQIDVIVRKTKTPDKINALYGIEGKDLDRGVYKNHYFFAIPLMNGLINGKYSILQKKEFFIDIAKEL